MYNIFNVNKVKINGYYVSNKSGYNSEFGFSSQLFFALVFNKNGFVIYLEDENEINISSEEIKEFLDLVECEKLGNVSKYSLERNQISVKFYDYDDIESFNSDTVDPNYYRELKGVVKTNSIFLDFYKSGYNYALNDYGINKIIENLKFDFVDFKI